MKMNVRENFQWRGRVYRAGDKPEDAVLEISKADFLAEMELGKHETSKRWLSPLLNHCNPGDDEAEDLLGGTAKGKKADEAEEKKADEADAIAAIYAEFDTIGKAYDRRWQLKRLHDELVKAKKEVGA